MRTPIEPLQVLVYAGVLLYDLGMRARGGEITNLKSG